jgi:rubredoxin
LNQILYRGAARPANGKPDTSLAGGRAWKKVRQRSATRRAGIGLHHNRYSASAHEKPFQGQQVQPADEDVHGLRSRNDLAARLAQQLG